MAGGGMFTMNLERPAISPSTSRAEIRNAVIQGRAPNVLSPDVLRQVRQSGNLLDRGSPEAAAVAPQLAPAQSEGIKPLTWLLIGGAVVGVGVLFIALR